MICCNRYEIYEMGFGLVRRGVKGFRSKVFSAHPLSVYLPGSGNSIELRIQRYALCRMRHAFVEVGDEDEV